MITYTYTEQSRMLLLEGASLPLQGVTTQRRPRGPPRTSRPSRPPPCIHPRLSERTARSPNPPHHQHHNPQEQIYIHKYGAFHSQHQHWPLIPSQRAPEPGGPIPPLIPTAEPRLLEQQPIGLNYAAAFIKSSFQVQTQRKPTPLHIQLGHSHSLIPSSPVVIIPMHRQERGCLAELLPSIFLFFLLMGMDLLPHTGPPPDPKRQAPIWTPRSDSCFDNSDALNSANVSLFDFHSSSGTE
ncbi:uncharacterized protein LOC123985780 [Micropterus dolomieu]|uniref:uncharacterized protein LOC123985780 n=1 Tax=Micropterus dolomieu TaxID=147949 RepID=UPI001E8E3B3E|nr:uncharacterized protein LOC123985780 [Micropterus dolomieu]